MEIKLLFGIISSIVVAFCYIPYLRDIFKKKTQPHIYYWLIWAIAQAIGGAAQLKDGAGYGSLALAVGAALCFVIFILSFKYGTRNITRFDGFCLLASLTAIIFYMTLKNPLWAVIAVTIVDFVAYLPTFRKTYQEPETETLSMFVMSALANILSLSALQNYTITTTLYMSSLFIINSSFVTMVMIRRKTLAGK